MEIPLIYILITAEILLILFGLSLTLAIILIRKSSASKAAEAKTDQDEVPEREVIELGNSYIDFLEQELERNQKKIKQQENIEQQAADEEQQDNDESGSETSPPPDESQSQLLQARELFLQIEKSAAEESEHDINFWEKLYAGLKELIDQYKSSETITQQAESETTTLVDQKVETREKVFYVETQGKKIDSEVNKLKDIIYEQENALSSMQKAMARAETEHPEDSESLAELKQSMESLERQLADSKMCMEVLEMENNRLQEEVTKLETDQQSLPQSETSGIETEKESTIDLEQMKEVMEQQEAKIEQLVETIENLKIDASQAEKLKQTINEFSRTSKEMMSCIAILEEENERLQAASHPPTEVDSSSDSEDLDELKSKIASLEEELIKKDVEYAKLQDEFSSMETEYLAMYEAMHGDNNE